jgi:hypothetical protein
MIGAGVALRVLAAAPPPITQTRDLAISHTNDTVALRIIKARTQSANAIEIRRGATVELAIPGTNTVATLKTRLGIQAFAFTNNAIPQTVIFPTWFSAKPVVTASADTNVLAFVGTVTSSNVVIGALSTNNVIQVIAIGAP